MLFKQKLFIPAIAAVLTLTFILSACSAPENETTGNITESSRETPQETTPEPGPNLPEKNMNYKEMKILTSDWWGYEPMNMVDISPDQYDGDLINDVAYERKMKIEQLYTMTVKTIDMTLQNSFESLRTSIMADDNAYDIAFIRGWNVAGLLSGNNYLLDLSALPYVNFDMPWWKKDAYDAFAINGKHFGVTGAMSTNDMMLIMGTCFNKNMVKDYGLESPYALFETGDWTLDKMAEMSKAVAKDLDGDGKMTKDDLWGINYTYETAVGMVNTAGVKIAELNGEGIPVITINTETAIGRMQNIFEKLLDES
ncbi:MAG: hypothetical protein FWD23_13970, partial [Oscillospiraceae bacterium]|nr:hypothetical protein [Oscillospiraceae bacterium]